MRMATQTQASESLSTPPLGRSGASANPPNSVFVPVTDSMIFDHPELIDGPIVPYQQGMACHGWLEVELNPQDHGQLNEVDTRQDNRRRAKAENLLQRAKNYLTPTSTAVQLALK